MAVRAPGVGASRVGAFRVGWVALLAALAGCASAPPERAGALADRRARLSALVVEDALAERRIRDSACRIDAAWCRTLRVFVLKGDVPIADYRPGGVLRVSVGMLARAAADDALAFVIAHERAHEALGHYGPNAAKADHVTRELAADAWARAVLHERAIAPAPAVALLQALREEAGRNVRAEPAGLAELDARLAALRAPQPR